MKKSLLLISVLALATAVSAATINITPTSPYDAEKDNLRLALHYATAGDEIVLADGTYLEKDDYLYFNKNITVRAAEGAHPVIDMYTYAQIKEGANVTIKGLKFNGAAQGSYSYYIRFYDATHTSLHLENCEFYSVKNYVLFGNSTSHTDSLKVNNCYFHNNKKNAIYFEASGTSGVQTCDKLVFTNSTVAQSDSLENWTSTIDIRPYGTDNTDAIKVIIDHCTFYDNPTINTDHSSIRPYHLTDVTISNCIFVKGPNQKEKRNATSCYGGTISNCLVYDLDYSANGHRSGPTITNNIVSNPLFNDLANNKYTYDGNWSTGSISPAREAGTDGSDLGDPRWYTDEVIPSTGFASDYDLLGNKAVLIGNIELSASNQIKYKGSGTPGSVKWKLHASRACYISALVDVTTGNKSGHKLTLTAYDLEGNALSNALAATSASYNDNDIQLPGTIFFPEAGDYILILTNSTNNSGALLEKITLSYFGGAVQNIATDANTTLNVADALFSSDFTRADGQVSPGSWKPTEQPLGYVKWNIATSETKFYDLTLNFNSTNAHSMAVNIYEDEEAEPVATVSESFKETTGDLTISGRIELVGGKNYIVKVTNPTSGSLAKVTSVVFAPVGSATALPGALEFDKAVLSEKARIIGDSLYFNEIGDTNPQGQWAQWEVTTNHNGLFLFTMGVASSNEQSYKITIFDENEDIVDFFEKNPGSGYDKEIKHYFALATGRYFVKVENTTSFSKGHLGSLVVTEPNNIVTINEAATDNSSWAGKVNDGNSYDVHIIRTIVAGMYNTICLPFEVHSAQLKEIFGTDVVLKQLESVTWDAETETLYLNFKQMSSIYPGTPYIIKTSRTIANPTFAGVSFATADPGSTTRGEGDIITFRGNFAKGTIPASDQNLFLGANDTFYFPTANIEILGMRAYFRLNESVSMSAIKRARIAEHEETATSISNVQSDNVQGTKVLRNGQLYIMYEGQMYDVQGKRVQ